MGIFDIRLSQIRVILTAFLCIAFALHLHKELSKFFDGKTTTSIRHEQSSAIKPPAITICAEQVYDTSTPGNFKSNTLLTRIPGKITRII